jgi:hypothetical protein
MADKTPSFKSGSVFLFISLLFVFILLVYHIKGKITISFFLPEQ